MAPTIARHPITNIPHQITPRALQGLTRFQFDTMPMMHHAAGYAAGFGAPSAEGQRRADRPASALAVLAFDLVAVDLVVIVALSSAVLHLGKSGVSRIRCGRRASPAACPRRGRLQPKARVAKRPPMGGPGATVRAASG